MKKSKKNKSNQLLPIHYHNLISSFIKESQLSNNHNESITNNPNPLHQSEVCTEMLTLINSIHTAKAQKITTIDHSLYTSLLIPQITEDRQCFAFISKMNKKLKKLYEYKIICTSPKKKHKIPYVKWNTYNNCHKMASHRDLGKQTQHLNNVSCSKAHLSSDDLWKNVNKDSTENDSSDDQSYSFSNRDSILPIKELNEQSPKHLLLRKHINNVVIDYARGKKANRIPLTCEMKKEYSKKVRLFNMLPMSKTFIPFNSQKTQPMTPVNDLPKGINQHQNSIMKFLHENLYTEYNDTIVVKAGKRKKDKPLIVVKEPSEFYINMTTEPNVKSNVKKPNIIKLAIKRDKMKTISIETNPLMTETGEKGMKKSQQCNHHHHRQKTEGNNKFMTLLDKYIGVDQSYNKKIIKHKKAYSQQYSSPIKKEQHIKEEEEVKSKAKEEESHNQNIQATLLKNLMSNDQSIHTKTSSIITSERYISPTQAKRCSNSKQSISFKNIHDWKRYSGASYHIV